MTGMVVVQDVRRGEGDDPEADDQAADGENPLAGRAVVGGERGEFTSAKDLAADADGHQESAESEREPCHG